MLTAAAHKMEAKMDEHVSNIAPELQQNVHCKTILSMQRKSLWGQNGLHVADLHKQVKDPDRAIWLLVLSFERAQYLAMFEAGMLRDVPFHRLERFMADVNAAAAETVTERLGSLYDELFDRCVIRPMKNHESRCDDAFGADDAYEVGIAFLYVMEKVKKFIYGGAFKQHADMAASLERAYNAHDKNIDAIKAAMAIIRSGKHKLTISDFEHIWVAVKMLDKRLEIVEHMLHDGELLDLDAAPLIQSMEDEIRKLLVNPHFSLTVAAEQATGRRERKNFAQKRKDFAHGRFPRRVSNIAGVVQKMSPLGTGANGPNKGAPKQAVPSDALTTNEWMTCKTFFGPPGAPGATNSTHAEIASQDVGGPRPCMAPEGSCSA